MENGGELRCMVVDGRDVGGNGFCGKEGGDGGLAFAVEGVGYGSKCWEYVLGLLYFQDFVW
jgi:hypothetical protein